MEVQAEGFKPMSYDETITNLFNMLWQANKGGDCWQRPSDADQSWAGLSERLFANAGHYTSQGIYGHVFNAIASIAGEEILERYIESGGTVDLTLANRK